MTLKNSLLISFLICLAAVFYLSLVPEPPQIPSDISGLDKIEHFAAYVVLTFLLTGYLKKTGLNRKRSFFFGIAAMIAVGGLIEVFQSYTGRTPEVADLLADAAGAAGGSLLSLFLLR